MASSTRGAPVVHQDYIARIRYSNALPPPPNPPRLLDIPNTGLAGGQYTAPGFASRLAREQPLNIEADAELGMPLDLVGMPGIFDGDESSIQAPPHPPPVHPHDRALLRPLAALGKPKFSDTGVSFLRRTEYISAYSSKASRFDPTAKTAVGKANLRAKRPQNLNRESPEFIKNQIAKSFDIAASNLKNISRAVHPSKRGLKLEAAYPVIPDLHAFGDVEGYIEVKFGKHPSLKDTYDSRLETGILMPQGFTEEQLAEKQRLIDAYTLDPVGNPQPPRDEAVDFRFYLLPNSTQSENYKRKFDPTDLMSNDETLYPDTGNLNEFDTTAPEGAEPIMGGMFRFGRIRTYETVSQSGAAEVKYDEEVIISIEEGERTGRQKGAYYYPVVSRYGLEPQRKRNMAKKFRNAPEEDDEEIAALNIRLVDPSEETATKRREFGEFPYGKPETEEVIQDDDEDGHHEPDDDVSQAVPAQLHHEGNGAV